MVKSKRFAYTIASVLMAAVLSVAINSNAEPEYLSPKLELRMIRMADLSPTDPASTNSQDQTEGYRFRLQAGLLSEWDDGVRSALSIQSQGLWDDRENGDRLETGIAEAYVSAESIGFLPLSASIGRQRLNAGRGLLLSSKENEWSFDSIDLDYDAFPSTIAIKGGRTVKLSPNTPLEWVAIGSIKYEPQTPFLREIEIYGGGVESYSGENFSPYGLRFEGALSPEMDIWSEFAGEKGRNPAGARLMAWIADIGAEYTIAHSERDTVALTRYTSASGGAGQSKRDFVPMMDRGLGGVVLRPALSNIQIYQIGIRSELTKTSKIGLDLYEYRRCTADEGVVGRMDWSNHGISVAANRNSRDLGWEANLSLELKLGSELTFRFIAGYFNYGQAYRNVDDDDALEGWIEMLWHY